MTTARYLREFVMKHPKYNHDSVISEEINYDLVCECERITNGLSPATGLLPKYSTKTAGQVPVAMSKADSYLSQKVGDPQNLNCAETL